MPAWASLPVALATGSLILAGTGFYWDVAVHIDRGRDPGPFGTPAHYPILIGLFGIFAAGWLALAMARGDEAARTGVRLTPTWVVPTSGLVMMACGAFALVGFPLDDIWHSIFGQDVTLWGPTHLIMLTGGQLMIPTILALLLEGRRSRTRTPAATTAEGRARRGLLGPPLLAVLGAGGVLAGLTIYQAEFGFGVPQYNLLFQPTLLAFTGALALVFARAVAGRGAAVGAVVMNLVLSVGFTLFVGPVAGQALPHFSTYLPAALCVEVAALIVPPRALTAFGVLSGALVGTLGTVGEWGWTHVWMPIPWPAHFLPSAIAIGVPAGICGGLVGAFVARALGGSRRFALPVAQLVARRARRGRACGAARLLPADASAGGGDRDGHAHPGRRRPRADHRRERDGHVPPGIRRQQSGLRPATVVAGPHEERRRDPAARGAGCLPHGHTAAARRVVEVADPNPAGTGPRRRARVPPGGPRDSGGGGSGRARRDARAHRRHEPDAARAQA